MDRDDSLKAELDEISPYTKQLHYFVAVARRQAKPNCSVEDGLRAVLITEAVFKSLESRGPVKVEQI